MVRLHQLIVAIPCAALIAASGAALAADSAGFTPDKKGTTLHLAAMASVELPNDKATVSFQAQETAATLAEATERLIKRVNLGVARLKASGVDAVFETNNVSSYPRYTEPRKGEAAKIVGWEVHQSISGKVSKVEDAAKLAQTGADYFAISGVNFSLSKAAQGRVQEQLMREAMKDVRAQAEVTASELGAGSEDIRVVSVTFNRSSQNMIGAFKAASPMMARAADASLERMPLPQFEAGRTSVSRQVNVELRVEP